MRRAFAFALLIVGALPAAAQRRGPAAPAAVPPELDTYINNVIRAFEVPGVSVAIVKDGKVVLTRGYGVRRLGDSTRVDARTLFGIASNTKAFTATALGMLVEEGKIEWDAPVIRYVPWFALSDPYVTRELTVRDLLVHRSGLGLGAGDLLWWPPTTYDRKEIARRLRYIPLATSFRSAYAYDNVLYGVAGEVIEAMSGQTWEDFVRTRIIEKVGMTGSNVMHSGAVETGGNVAGTHARVDGKVRLVTPFSSDITNPAGGINSSAEDMAKWLIVQLDSGRTATGRLWSQVTQRRLWALITPIPIGTPAPELAALRPNFNGYGLGFHVQDYRGRKIVTHTGGLPGYVSRLTMIPDMKLGVMVLTNQESGAAFEAITYRILDHYLQAPPTDWLAAFKTVVARGDSMIAAADASAVTARDTASRPSLPLAKYAGTYTDPWYGDVEITRNGDKLGIRFTKTPMLVGDLEHWQYDTFVARWRERELRADAFVTFHLTPEGGIEQVKMRAVSDATDFSFDFHDLVLKPARRPQ